MKPVSTLENALRRLKGQLDTEDRTIALTPEEARAILDEISHLRSIASGEDMQ